MKNLIFGAEDSLVSTVGLISGVAVANTSKPTIILTGMILIFVEAFSMGIGSFLSDDFAVDIHENVHSTRKKRKISPYNSYLGGIIMFWAYFVSGFIPLFPYVFLSSANAFWISIVLSLITLFLLGSFSAYVFKVNVLRHGLKMAIIGGIAIGIGVIVGSIVQR